MSKKILSLGGGVMMAIGLFAMAGTAFAATPSVVSVKLTGPSVITVVYSEPVTTNSWDYTNFTGNLSGLGVTSISGSGSSVITLSLSGTPIISNGSSGYLMIGNGVTSVSTGSSFPGASYNVTSAQAPILSSVSVSVINSGNTFSTVGSQVQLTFSTNESVVNPTVTLLGHTIGVSGTGPGPYTINYTLVTGDAQGTVNATINFTDTNGNSGSATVNVLSNGSGSTVSAGGSITSNANSSGVLYPGNSITFTLVPSTPEPSARSVTGSYNGVPLSWYTTNNGATYTAVYTVAVGQVNTAYPLQISGVSLVDQYGNTVGPFSGSDIQKTINATAVTGPITIYQASPIVTPTTNQNPSYGFVSTEAGTIHYVGDCSGETTSASAGLNTVVMNTLPIGTHNNCMITVADASGNVSNQLVISPFTITAAGATTATQTASSSDLTTEMQSLQSQLAALQSKSGTGTTNYNFTEFLSVGSQDAQVTALQQRLKSDGFYSGSVTGYFGTLTEVAVGKYQAAHGIAVKGYVGPSTRTALNSGK
ncbi:MAG: peptidoglycan-binding domain-containing protein [Minisyncoccia bacterium]